MGRGCLKSAGLLAAAALLAPAAGRGAGGALSVGSPAFAEGEAIPVEYTADGRDLSPPLTITGVPSGAAGLALTMTDPDAPGRVWVHWVAWNIPAGTARIPAGELPEGSAEGRNSWGRSGYGGPEPPPGQTHRYVFTVLALDTPLHLPAQAGLSDLLRAAEGHVLATARLTGRYGPRR